MNPGVSWEHSWDETREEGPCSREGAAPRPEGAAARGATTGTPQTLEGPHDKTYPGSRAHKSPENNKLSVSAHKTIQISQDASSS